MIDRNFVKFLKEQYPKGTRVRLNSMSDPYAPVEPGTEGSVEMVDDAGQLLMKWDNGRTLALIPGEDSFSVLPPKLTTLKLYMPMTVDRFESDGWGGTENEPTELSNYEAIRYVDNINAALRREDLPAEAERGLMHYYGKNDEVDRKVRKVTFSAEVRDQKLWGVAECQVAGELTSVELTELKEFVSGQASDGFGEGFEQREISVPDGHELHAHLWQWENWCIQTEQECFSHKLAEGLPELCYSVHESTGELIVIKRGETGYHPCDYSTPDKERNVELADFNNDKLGVTPAQRKAMEIGSLCGWDVPGADPARYLGDNQLQRGGMTLE